MAVNEIVVGLRNAVERGQPIETAVNSYINAGYPAEEVREAAREIDLGAMQQIPQEEIETPPKMSKKEEIKEEIKKETKPIKVKKKRSGLIIALIVLVVILLIVLGTLFFFGEEILSLLFS